MAAFYNEIDPYPAQWLRNLIAAGHLPEGDVDERDIREVSADDLKGYVQAHFFSGIGGWPLALRLAGWPDDRPVWTGSPPCQALSSAAHGRHTADDLLPEFAAIVASGRPRVVFGEQVADRKWVDRLCDEMEAMDYEVGAAVLPAVAVGKDHARPRLFFVCHTDRDRESVVPIHAEASRLPGHRHINRIDMRANGLSASVARVRAGFGNAIVPQVAQAFIESVMECRP